MADCIWVEPNVQGDWRLLALAQYLFQRNDLYPIKIPQDGRKSFFWKVIKSAKNHLKFCILLFISQPVGKKNQINVQRVSWSDANVASRRWELKKERNEKQPFSCCKVQSTGVIWISSGCVHRIPGNCISCSVVAIIILLALGWVSAVASRSRETKRSNAGKEKKTTTFCCFAVLLS